MSSSGCICPPCSRRGWATIRIRTLPPPCRMSTDPCSQERASSTGRASAETWGTHGLRSDLDVIHRDVEAALLGFLGIHTVVGVEPAPAAGALILAVADRRRADEATDALVPLVVERMAGDVVVLDVGQQTVLAPVDHGIELEDLPPRAVLTHRHRFRRVPAVV